VIGTLSPVLNQGSLQFRVKCRVAVKVIDLGHGGDRPGDIRRANAKSLV
jgi:hypothetical protein